MATTFVIGSGDVHAGSTLAPCPPDGIELDDGGTYVPNKIQVWLYDLWCRAWNEMVPRLADRYKPDAVTVVFNGDLTEGIHHNTPQATPLVGQHFRCAHELLKVGPLKLKPRIHMVRGTEAHVGRSGELEEGLARTLRAEGHDIVYDPDTGQASSFWRRFDVDGKQFDCRHHGRFGQRTHTKDSYMRLYAHDIWESHVRSGQRPPDIALRSHWHNYGDSGKVHDMPTRVVALPAWQILTAYGHRRAIEDLGKHGLVVFVVRDGELLEPHAILFEPERPTVITETP